MPVGFWEALDAELARFDADIPDHWRYDNPHQRAYAILRDVKRYLAVPVPGARQEQALSDETRSPDGDG